MPNTTKTKRINPSEGFHVLASTPRSQAATMVLDVGEKTGGPDNKHPGSDQWLYVVAGRGVAIVGGQQVDLAPRDLVLIEADTTHAIENTGDVPLETLNFYCPPVY